MNYKKMLNTMTYQKRRKFSKIEQMFKNETKTKNSKTSLRSKNGESIKKMLINEEICSTRKKVHKLNKCSKIKQ